MNRWPIRLSLIRLNFWHGCGVRVPVWLAVATLAWSSSVLAQEKLPETVSFNAHIRPLMSRTCFVCHGPDESMNDSGFRIDSFAAATSPLPSDDELSGISPGDPEASEVYLRITGQGDGEAMPPDDFRHQLTGYEKALVRKWIEQGAAYQQHWSYSPVRRPEVPSPGKHADKVVNPIDAFVLKRLEQEGLDPAELADRATLLRRLSLDLIGLPPAPEEVGAFEADSATDAWERQVERLLASPHFGERMAIPWLDLVRFADTVGFHGDQNQRIFPYRDYVIESFNRNKPFDQFTREQIAGDLFDDPSEEQLIATGFLRLNMMTREGGAQPGEYLAKYKADRVRALGTAWLGSTLGCCECHNHKYDPFTARDFYALGAFFDDLQQWGVYSNYQYTPNPDLRGYSNDFPFPPEMRVASDSLRAEIETLGRERDRVLSGELDQDILTTDRFQRWVAALREQLADHPDGWIAPLTESVSTTHGTQHQVLPDGSLLLTGQGDASEVVTVSLRVPQPVTASSVQIQVLPDPQNNGLVGRGKDGRFKLGLTTTLDHDPRRDGAPPVVPNQPRYVRVGLNGSSRILSLAEVQVFVKGNDGNAVNVARDGSATQSSTYGHYPAGLAIDGITDGDLQKVLSTTHTRTESNPWWELDLGSAQVVGEVAIWNRLDGNYQNRLDGFEVTFLDEDRRVLFRTRPQTPAPSVRFQPPGEVELQPEQPLAIAWSAADRQDSPVFINGREPLFLNGDWRSGPARWQLPFDENRLPHHAVFHFDRPVPVRPDQRLVLRLHSGDVGRVRIALTPLGHASPGRDAASAELRDALGQNGAARSERQNQLLLSLFHRSTVPVDQQHRSSRYYRDRIAELRSGLAMTLVAQPLPEEKIPVSRVLPRGDWQDTTGEVTPPGFPHFLPQGDAAGERRLTRRDLAAWLVSRDNPLTARHFVNHTWKQFFGSGLSSRIDDLGNQGEWPSHPRLLDWMAAEFMESGWDVKHLVRLIVTSHTYRQAAAVRSDLAERDPYNRLLAQQTARRLEAEIIRDNALAIAGLLHTDLVGGRSVFPYQPTGHYSNLQFPNRRYQASQDWRQYRRGVYMHWQRTFLHPMLVNFDAPSRDECAADRPLSNSPQQALTLLNDPTFVEASVAMAGRLLSENPQASAADLVNQAFLKAVARNVSSRELESLLALLERQKSRFREHPDDAQKSLSVGLQQPNPALDPVDHAAWAQVCRVILNLHETITRY